MIDSYTKVVDDMEQSSLGWGEGSSGLVRGGDAQHYRNAVHENQIQRCLKSTQKQKVQEGVNK